MSLDRLGSYWRDHGEAAGRDALHAYMGPAMFERIAHARELLNEVLEAPDPAIMERLEAMSDDEEAIGYWAGPAP